MTDTASSQRSGRSGRRVGLIAVVATLVAAVLGGGAWTAYSYLSGGGPGAAVALPSTTVAILSVDLDPSAGQKVAAIKAIGKFPALKRALGLNADDDLRRFAFDKLTGTGRCTNLAYARDVEPWLGKRAAVAAVDLGGKDPVPAVALQVSDTARARVGMAALVACAGPGEDFGYVVGTDYVIASDSPEHARAIQTLAKQHSLADDASYQKWTAAAGDQGVVTFYVAARAATLLRDKAGSLGEGLLGGTPFARGSGGAARTLLAGFRGLGATVRFADGGMELSVAVGGVDQLSSRATVGAQVGQLPKDTAFALGLGVPGGYAKKTLEQLDSALGTGSGRFSSEVESRTGLDLPDDLQTLLGSALTLSLGGERPANLDDLAGPQDLPVGLVVHGDADRIKAVIAKVEEHTGHRLADLPLVVESNDRKVVLSPSKTYADQLLKTGGLGGGDAFGSVVPDASRATALLYVDFDSPWRKTLVDLVRAVGSDQQAERVDANTAPLRALGVSSWVEGGVTRVLVKVTTD